MNGQRFLRKAGAYDGTSHSSVIALAMLDSNLVSPNLKLQGTRREQHNRTSVPCAPLQGVVYRPRPCNE